jgi:hypothetical protein
MVSKYRKSRASYRSSDAEARKTRAAAGALYVSCKSIMFRQATYGSSHRQEQSHVVKAKCNSGVCTKSILNKRQLPAGRLDAYQLISQRVSINKLNDVEQSS